MDLTKILVTSLIPLIIPPSIAYADYFTISKNKNADIFEGVKEEYNPIRVGLEFERDGILYVPFVGIEGNDFEFGFDVGLKQKISGWYSKETIGLGYESKEFKRHDFRQNVHISLGVGKDFGDWYLGGIFDHYSIGNKITKQELNKKNNGINTFGLQIGRKW